MTADCEFCGVETGVWLQLPGARGGVCKECYLRARERMDSGSYRRMASGYVGGGDPETWLEDGLARARRLEDAVPGAEPEPEPDDAGASLWAAAQRRAL